MFMAALGKRKNDAVNPLLLGQWLPNLACPSSSLAVNNTSWREAKLS